MSTKAPRSRFGALLSLVLTLGVMTGALWVFTNREYAADQVAVWQYQPSSEIAQLAHEARFSEQGEFYFYASHPQLHKDQDAFNTACPRQEKTSAILGCYVSRKIHLYDVPDERLMAVPTVTAAHEMLHAAWDRMTIGEQERIGALLRQEYEALQSTSADDLKSRMEYYQRTSPDHLDDELHSIIATEVGVVAEELEAHYRQFFDDRQQVVRLYESYNNQFVELTRSTDTLRVELEQLSVEINAMTGQYNARIDQLNSDIDTFNARAAGAYYASEAAFSRDRDALMARVAELEELRRSIDAKSQEYESKRLAYNAQVDESNSLFQALDSTLAPAPSV